MTAPEFATEDRQVGEIPAPELNADLGACRVLALDVLVNRQWDHCTKAEYSRKVSLERSLIGPPQLIKQQRFSNQELGPM